MLLECKQSPAYAASLACSQRSDERPAYVSLELQWAPCTQSLKKHGLSNEVRDTQASVSFTFN